MSAFRTTVLAGAVGLVAALTLSACGSSNGGGASSPPVSTPSSAPASTGSAPPSGSPTSTAAVATPALPSGGPVPARFVPYSVTFASTTTSYVLGTAPCSHAPCTSVVRSVDGGAHWVGIHAPVAPLSTNGVPASAVSRIRFADPMHGYAFRGGLWVTSNGGQSWQQQHIGSSANRVFGLETAGGYVWAVTEDCAGSSGCPTAELYRARVGSTSWTDAGQFRVAAPSGGYIVPQLAVVGTTAFLAGGTALLRATPTANLTNVSTSLCVSGQSVVAIAVADAAHLDAICTAGGAAGSTQQQLRGTTNGGATWSNAGPARLVPSDITGIADNAHGVLVESASSGGSELLRTTNDGASFQNARVSAPSGGIPWIDLGFTTPTQGIVVLVGRGLYLSHDAGASWAAVSF